LQSSVPALRAFAVNGASNRGFTAPAQAVSSLRLSLTGLEGQNSLWRGRQAPESSDQKSPSPEGATPFNFNHLTAIHCHDKSDNDVIDLR